MAPVCSHDSGLCYVQMFVSVMYVCELTMSPSKDNKITTEGVVVNTGLVAL